MIKTLIEITLSPKELPYTHVLFNSNKKKNEYLLNYLSKLPQINTIFYDNLNLLIKHNVIFLYKTIFTLSIK